jgi:hypothetical protein
MKTVIGLWWDVETETRVENYSEYEISYHLS